MNTPQVSIILPTYNRKKFLAASLESCIRQTELGLEIIVVDDASSDETSKYLEEMAKQYASVKVLRHEVNQGLPTSLNDGLSLARGEFLTWTSDDNLYESNAIASLLSEIKNSEADIVYTDISLIDDHGNPVGRQNSRDSRFLFLTNIIGACFLFRRRVWDTVGPYRAEVSLIEDYDFWLRAKAAGFGFKHVSGCFYQYRLHSNSLTEQKKYSLYLSLQKVLESIHPFPKNYRDQSFLKIQKARTYAHLHDRKNVLKETLPLLFTAPHYLILYGKLALFYLLFGKLKK